MYAKEDLMNTGRIVRIRDPIRPEDRKVIAKNINFRKGIPRNEGWIGGQDRSFDEASNSYGNSFTNFEEWPDDVPMDAQVSAEYFLFMCFKDTVLRMMANRVLSEKEAESIIWTASMGMLVSAAATVQYILNRGKEGDNA